MTIDASINDLHIHGSKFNLPYRRLRYKIYPCSLPNPADCASFEELAGLQFFNIGMFRAGNYSDKANPKVLFGEVETIVPLSIASTVVMTTYLKKNFIYDDDIGFLGERLTSTYVDTDKFISTPKEDEAQSDYLLYGDPDRWRALRSLLRDGLEEQLREDQNPEEVPHRL